MFQLRFDTDNAAFHEHDDAMEDEVARILHRVADEVTEGLATGKFLPIRDYNGNTIGTWKLEDK